MADRKVAIDATPTEQWAALDIGSDDAIFESEPKGTWVHAGLHLTSGTTGPQTLSLPFAIAALGWGPGLFFLCIGGIVSFYSYYLQAAVVERITADSGRPCGQFRNLSAQVLGKKWSAYLVAPLQFVVCFATVVSCIVLGGQSMKAIFQGQELSLYQFTIVFGCIHMILSQLPSLHSLRHLNLLSLITSTAYCALVVYGSIVAGISHHVPKTNHNISGTFIQRMFGVFNSLSILSNVYGNVIIVEIQATIKAPSLKNMMWGLYMSYVIIVVTTFPVAISGYWAFGRMSNGNVLLNIFPIEGIQYVPSWMCIVVNVLIFIQLIVSSLMYSQPSFAILEARIMDNKKAILTLRSIIARVISRSVYTAFATLLATMLPYFGSINALIGAIGYTPLVFVVPMILYNLTFRPLYQSMRLWINYIMVAIFSLITIFGCLASFRQLMLDAKMYHLFANL